MAIDRRYPLTGNDDQPATTTHWQWRSAGDEHSPAMAIDWRPPLTDNGDRLATTTHQQWRSTAVATDEWTEHDRAPQWAGNTMP
ncbi:hypothetical protein [Mycetohabitans sp. B46]|uniref:hypothetical protein n=1 Tax=Mycetohabitans sp. B46 TaxID=2772536 RepID=UPI00307EDC3D